MLALPSTSIQSSLSSTQEWRMEHTLPTLSTPTAMAKFLERAGCASWSPVTLGHLIAGLALPESTLQDLTKLLLSLLPSIPQTASFLASLTKDMSPSMAHRLLLSSLRDHPEQSAIVEASIPWMDLRVRLALAKRSSSQPPAASRPRGHRRARSSQVLDGRNVSFLRE